jgi:hypothetical protein
MNAMKPIMKSTKISGCNEGWHFFSFASGGQGDSFRENRPPGPPAKAFDYFHMRIVDRQEITSLLDKKKERISHQ